MYIPSRIAGIAYGLTSSAAFGLIPLFTLPLVAVGIPVETALVYRFGLAAAVMALIAAIFRVPLAIGWNAFFKLAILSIFYLLAVLTYFYALMFLPSGVVATLQFLYPVMVMLIMVVFFHEPFRLRTAAAVVLAFLGAALLSLGESLAQAAETTAPVIGVALSLLAGLANGLYYVGIQVIKLPQLNGFVMTFYVMLLGAALCLANAILMNALTWIDAPAELGMAVLLALVTAVYSNLALIFAIRSIGSTLAAILGVLEPLTAVAVGCLVFAEPFTSRLALGVLLIILAVLLALKKPQQMRQSAN